MSFRWAPTGALDLSTDPPDLPEQVEGKATFSGAMTRATNLRLHRAGRAETRLGSSKVSATAVTGCSRLVEHAGDRYEFTSTAIYRNEASIASGLTAGSSNWVAAAYNAYNVETEALFATDGTNRKRLEGANDYEWGIAAPTVAPVADGQCDQAYTFDWEFDDGHATGAALKVTTEHDDGYEYLFDWEGALLSGEGTGADGYSERPMWVFESTGYSDEAAKALYQYTYARYSADGVLECESNASPAGNANVDSGHGLTWTASSDAQVTHVRLYRSVLDGLVYQYAGKVAVGTTTTCLSPIDDALDDETPPADHDRPPTGITALLGPVYNGSLLALVGNRLYWCKSQQPEYWPATSYAELGGPQYPGVALEDLGGVAYAFTRWGISEVQGTGGDSFFPLRRAALAGAVSADAVLAVEGAGIYHVGPDGGLYLFTGSSDHRVDQSWRPVAEGDTVEDVPGLAAAYVANVLLAHWGGRLWFGYPSAQYANHWLVIDLGDKRLCHYSYGSAAWRSVAMDRTNDRLLAVDSSGYVWQLEDPAATDDGGTAISWDAKSKDFGDTLRRQFPRFAHWDVAPGSGGVASGQVLLDDAALSTHAIATRSRKKRLLDTGNGYRMAMRVYGTGTVVIYEAEVE